MSQLKTRYIVTVDHRHEDLTADCTYVQQVTGSAAEHMKIMAAIAAKNPGIAYALIDPQYWPFTRVKLHNYLVFGRQGQ